MAAATHLEKMGRELNCPICLSLLNSAVSLTCNHVFCNSCIIKSMKSVSDCPVCKVPYRRREVRPAPHMDNLVSIYKSMEVASGMSIFFTQSVLSSKLPDEDNQVECGFSHGCQDAVATFRENAAEKRKLKGKGSKKAFNTRLRDCGPSPVKPSFPTKKRVHVPQRPLSENPLRDDMDEKTQGPKSSSIASDGKRFLNENGELVLSPFFWLRDDEDAENLSQTADRDHIIDTPPPSNAPCFSDMKDSDDEIPSEMTPRGEMLSKSNVLDRFDSEMFEWTQRACSPELCSSPLKLQVDDTEEFDETEEKEINVVFQSTTEYGQERCTGMEKNTDIDQGTGIENFELPSMSSPSTERANGQSETKYPRRGGQKASKRAQMKCTIKIVDEVLEKMCDTNGNYTNFDKVTSERAERAGCDTNATKPNIEMVPTLSVKAKPVKQGVSLVTRLPAGRGKKRGCGEGYKMAIESCDKIVTRYEKGSSVRSKKCKQDSSDDKILKVPILKHHRGKDAIPELSPLSFPTVEDESVSDISKEPTKRTRKIKPSLNFECNHKLRSSKRLEVCFHDNSEDKLDGDHQEDHQECHAKVSTTEENQLHNVCGHPDFIDLDHTSSKEKGLVTNGAALRKCETFSNKIQCAFCHSAEDSEASGEMVHYIDGRPVQADYNGGCNLIHSHRNCTEWSPNVYFEGEIAVNLEAELARSRRIKCSLCGIKGAALGCYEKSCRKSFHFPCVKLIPQCRWDNDNFVMLCPLHVSSKLPNEISRTQEKGRKKSILKRQSQSSLVQVAVKMEGVSSRRWTSVVSAKKLVICCSALTTAERETVSEFERLSKVIVSKKWDSSVTHVIASTDENGACRRTLKVLMGILEGKWILSIEWIKACIMAMEPVEEEQYEISSDIHGIKDGPKIGRLRLLNKQPKIFDGLRFYFTGDFIPSYKGYLHDLVIAAGGTVLHRKPVSHAEEALLCEPSTSSTFIIYSLELPDKCNPSQNAIFNQRRFEAEALAHSSGAKVASNSWVLNSIAGCKLQIVS